MAQVQDTMMNPRIEDLMGKVESKFRLVTLAALRARQINSYFGQLGEGLGATIPPQVTSTARTSLSLAFQEIAARIERQNVDARAREPSPQSIQG